MTRTIRYRLVEKFYYVIIFFHIILIEGHSRHSDCKGEKSCNITWSSVEDALQKSFFDIVCKDPSLTKREKMFSAISD